MAIPRPTPVEPLWRRFFPKKGSPAYSVKGAAFGLFGACALIFVLSSVVESQSFLRTRRERKICKELDELAKDIKPVEQDWREKE